jgi:hypothetical protein
LPGQFVIGEARCIGTNGNCVWTTTTCCSPTTPPCEMELKVIISNETGDSYGVFDPNRQNLPPACGPGNTEIPPVPPGSFENQTLQIGPYPLSCDGAYTRKTCYIRKVTHRVPSQTPGCPDILTLGFTAIQFDFQGKCLLCEGEGDPD